MVAPLLWRGCYGLCSHCAIVPSYDGMNKWMPLHDGCLEYKRRVVVRRELDNRNVDNIKRRLQRRKGKSKTKRWQIKNILQTYFYLPRRISPSLEITVRPHSRFPVHRNHITWLSQSWCHSIQHGFIYLIWPWFVQYYKYCYHGVYIS